MTFLADLRALADENGRLTADLIVTRAERDLERKRADRLEEEIRALRAKAATRETEAAIAAAYGEPLEAVGS